MSSSRNNRLHSVRVKSRPSSSCLNSQTMACMPSSMNICLSDWGLFRSRLRRRPSCFWKTSNASVCSSSSISLWVVSSARLAGR